MINLIINEKAKNTFQTLVAKNILRQNLSELFRKKYIFWR